MIGISMVAMPILYSVGGNVALLFGMLKPKATTQIGAQVAKNVALATLVVTIDRCQKNRSPAKARPAKMSARPIRRSDGAPASAIRSQAQSSGSARATRQKALANGPTSARRTKIGDMPIARAPTTSAAKGAPKPPCGLAAGEACVIRF